ncbi:MAG TPA: methyl-accepting chemotaxis protein [Gallionellaceae bacterium]|nr:methyl-accepting chemotaxis protein [Gallionellaceae bacterium]
MFNIVANSIRNKLLLAVLSASVLVAVALAVSLLNLSSISDSFVTFVEDDQATLQAYTSMYTQGLQGGQALRNIVLNPSNQKGHDNLAQAQKKFEEALQKATALSGNHPRLESALKEIGDKWRATLIARQHVLSAANSSQSESIKILNEEETPAWRDTRELLLKSIDALEKDAQEIKNNITARAHKALIVSLIIGVVALVLGCASVIMVAESIKQSLDTVSRSMANLASGKGDLTQRMPVTTQDEVGRMAAAFNRFMEHLQGIIRQIRNHGDELSSASTELSATAAHVADSSRNQSDSASSTAAAIEQMTVSIASIADAADAMRKLSNNSLERSHEGNERLSQLIGEVDKVESAVSAIAESVNKFVQSTNLITSMTNQVKEIADQTNLLALNAAIEAARAGEQGRGFAVVADEVRKLAEKSSKSAGEIDAVTQSLGQQSEAVEKAIQVGRGALSTSQDYMENLAIGLSESSQSIKKSNQSVDEIALSVQEQKSASNEIAQNIERIARMTEDNSLAISETASAASRLETLAAQLQSHVAKFRVD